MSENIIFKKKWFDGAEYIKLQREKILKEASLLENWKLYIQIDSKFLEDNHAQRTIPGYLVDSQKLIFSAIKEQIEIIFCVNADEILLDKEQSIEETNFIIKRCELLIWIRPHIVISDINIQQSFDKILEFEQEYQRRNYKVREKYKTLWVADTKTLLSENWFGNDDHIPLFKKIILVINNSKNHQNKIMTCLAQIYNDQQIWLNSEYRRFSMFPIADFEKNHPTNIAYQLAIWNKEIIEENAKNIEISDKLLESMWKSKSQNINEIYPRIQDQETIAIASYQEIQRRNNEQKFDQDESDAKDYMISKWYDYQLKIS